MSIAFYTATSGLIGTQKAMDITANNIANVETNGFKPLRASFSDVIYTVRNEDEEDVEVGHGTKIDKTDLMFDAGALVSTGGTLDFATASEGVFALLKANGNTVYTKNGSFQLQQNDGQWNLIDANGSKVLDYEGNPIIASYDEEGALDIEAITDSIGVYKFENPYGLDLEGSNYFVATASSGEAAADQTLEKRNGYAEASSANISDQMVKVIQYQKAFSFSSQMVQTADEMENIVNNLR